MRIRQGTAPAVLYRDGRKIWEFTAGALEMRPFDPQLYALLLERGAEPVETHARALLVEPEPEPIERTPAPEPEAPRPSRKRNNKER